MEKITDKILQSRDEPLPVPKRAYFNFEINQTMTVENIIMATFANPDRRNFAQSKINDNNYSLHPDNIDPTALIFRIRTEFPQNLRKNLIEKRIQLYDTSRLNSEVDKTHWLSELKELKWYGPFDCNSYYMFQTATNVGNFQGLLLEISLSEKFINLRFVDKDSNECGSSFDFRNDYL